MSKTKFQKSQIVLKNSKAKQWCYVNADNEFEFMNSTFIIDDSVEEYKVYNKAGEVEDFTNEALMEKILVVLYEDNIVRYFNQDLDEIDSSKIKLKVT